MAARLMAEQRLNPALSDPMTCAVCCSFTLLFVQTGKKKELEILLVLTCGMWNLFHLLVFLRLPSCCRWTYQGCLSP